MQRKLAAERRDEIRLKREEKNALFRAYGYHWKKTEQLTQEQLSAVFHSEDDDGMPEWTLLSPLDMPVSEYAASHWLGERGYFPDDVIAFLIEHGFTSEGKDARGIWRILPPSGNETINLRQALQALERVRLEKVRAREEAERKRMQAAFERSAKSLQEKLELHGSAWCGDLAWGYAFISRVERLPDGKILVETKIDGDYQKETLETAEEVVDYLFSNDGGGWEPGEAWE